MEGVAEEDKIDVDGEKLLILAVRCSVLQPLLLLGPLVASSSEELLTAGFLLREFFRMNAAVIFG